MTAATPIWTRSTYESGMFSIEDRRASDSQLADTFEFMGEIEATCFHEAGHAVVGYALGPGLVHIDITMQANEDGSGVGIGGEAMHAKAAAVRPGGKLNRGCITSALIHGISTCAGPAAERRHRQETGKPLRLLLATLGDHAQLDNCGKHLEMNFGRNSFAYRRAAWTALTSKHYVRR